MFTRLLPLLLTSFFLVTLATTSHAGSKTQHPVFLVHGVLGWDQAFDIGSYYFGDDFGTAVSDTCDSFWELVCNRRIDKNQDVRIVQLTSLESTYFRGNELFDIVDAYVQSEGLKRLGSQADGLSLAELRTAIAGLDQRPHVNLIGHSQGGIDSRYVAYLLRQSYGYNVAKVVVTVSSPHRGSGIAQSMYDLRQGSTFEQIAYTVLVPAFEYIWSGILSNGLSDGKEQNAENMLKSMGYYDIDPEDGIVTGMQSFNQAFPIHDGSNYLNADKYVSFITAEKRSNLSYPMQILVSIAGDIEGYVFQMDAPDTPESMRGLDQSNLSDTEDLRDDDGFIPLYSQQAGLRMSYSDYSFSDDEVDEMPAFGEVQDVENPNPAQMGDPAQGGLDGVLDVGHFEEITLPLGVLLTNANGGVEFDELGYYSAMIDYIAENE